MNKYTKDSDDYLLDIETGFIKVGLIIVVVIIIIVLKTIWKTLF